MCGPLVSTVRTWIPIKLSFDAATQLCNSSLNGSLADFNTWADLQLTALFQPTKINATPAVIWLPYKRNGSSSLFYNVFNQKPFNSSFWSSGQPGLYKQCLVCDLKGCRGEDCRLKQSFYCSFDRWPIVAKLRGLCSKTALSLTFYPSLKFGSFSWLSLGGTYIIYNITTKMWQTAVANGRVSAEAPASYNSFLVGTHYWTVHNSFSCYEGKTVNVRVSLALCSDDYFNCDDGGCVPLDAKCDGQNDCNDGSDELYCATLQLPDNYNKQLSPLVMPELKAKVNVKFEVINVLGVNENMGKMRIKFRLSETWNDYRLNFLDIWDGYAMNSLITEEMALIWLPTVNFDNAELYQFDYDSELEVSVVNDTYTYWTLAPASQLYKSMVYSGSEKSFYMRSIIRFEKDF